MEGLVPCGTSGQRRKAATTLYYFKRYKLDIINHFNWQEDLYRMYHSFIVNLQQL